jgi:hypothetical protein
MSRWNTVVTAVLAHVQSPPPCFRLSEERRADEKQQQNSFALGDEVLMKNQATNRYEFVVTVVSMQYDEHRAGWDYMVKDSSGVDYRDLVAEGDLRDRKG